MIKNTLFFVAMSIFAITSLYGQSTRSIEKNEWLLSLGVNAINSQGTKSPVEDISDWAFRYPLAVAVETKWSRLFSIEIAASINGFKADDAIDAGSLDENITYFSLDTHLKYYFGEYIFPKTDWLDFYGLAGIGYFDLDDGNLSGNLGGGAVVWFDRGKSYGLKAQALAKLAFDHSNSGTTFANNHFQYNLMLVFRL